MSAHRLPQDMAFADWLRVLPDPGSGVPIPNSVFGQLALRIAGSETNTLPDPTKVGLRFVITALAQAVGSRVVTAATKLNVAGNTIITFSAVDQSVELLAVPYAGNAAGARWQVVYANGAALS